jgi:CRP-like cAMP-binding protein
MAILDDEPRSATVVARESVRLLVLDGDSLKSLLREMPEIALELLRVMTARVRVSERRLVTPSASKSADRPTRSEPKASEGPSS